VFLAELGLGSAKFEEECPSRQEIFSSLKAVMMNGEKHAIIF
jgi:hypothetical protein